MAMTSAAQGKRKLYWCVFIVGPVRWGCLKSCPIDILHSWRFLKSHFVSVCNSSNTGKEDSSQATAAAPKRIKRDPCEPSKPQRIRRFGG